MKSQTGDIKAALKPTARIAALLKHFSNKSDIPFGDLRAMLDGDVLDNEQTLQELELEHGDSLDIVVQKK